MMTTLLEALDAFLAHPDSDVWSYFRAEASNLRSLLVDEKADPIDLKMAKYFTTRQTLSRHKPLDELAKAICQAIGDVVVDERLIISTSTLSYTADHAELLKNHRARYINLPALINAILDDFAEVLAARAVQLQANLRIVQALLNAGSDDDDDETLTYALYILGWWLTCDKNIIPSLDTICKHLVAYIHKRCDGKIDPTRIDTKWLPNPSAVIDVVLKDHAARIRPVAEPEPEFSPVRPAVCENTIEVGGVVYLPRGAPWPVKVLDVHTFTAVEFVIPATAIKWINTGTGKGYTHFMISEKVNGSRTTLIFVDGIFETIQYWNSGSAAYVPKTTPKKSVRIVRLMPV